MTPPPPLQEPLQDPQVGLAHALIKSLLLCEILFAPSKSEASVFLSPGGSCNKGLLGLKAKCPGGSSTWCWTPRLGGLMQALNSHSCGRPSGGCKDPPVCGSPTYGCGIWEHWVPVPHARVSLWLLSLVVKDLSW